MQKPLALHGSMSMSHVVHKLCMDNSCPIEFLEAEILGLPHCCSATVSFFGGISCSQAKFMCMAEGTTGHVDRQEAQTDRTRVVQQKTKKVVEKKRRRALREKGEGGHPFLRQGI